jgi:hypothetical protein
MNPWTDVMFASAARIQMLMNCRNMMDIYVCMVLKLFYYFEFFSFFSFSLQYSSSNMKKNDRMTLFVFCFKF